MGEVQSVRLSYRSLRQDLSNQASFGFFAHFAVSLSCEDMKTIKNASKSGGALQEHHLNTLVVRPLARRIKKQRRDCIAQGNRILNKLQEINKSIEAIARAIARQTRRGV